MHTCMFLSFIVQSRADAGPSAAELSAQAVASYTSAKERKMPAVPRRDETNVLVRVCFCISDHPTRTVYWLVETACNRV